MSERTVSFVLRSIRQLAPLLLAAPLGAQTAPEPMTLRRAAELALARAPSVSVARAAREEGTAQAGLARGAFHPSLWVTTTPGYTYGLPTAIVGEVPSVAGVELRQTIYNPARRSIALQAEAREASLEGALEQTCSETVEKVVAAYGRAWVDQVSIEAARRRLEASESALRRVTALFDEGRRTELDVERGRLRVARARQRLLNAESDRDLDLLELKRLIGWPGSAPLALAGDPESAVPEAQSAESLETARAADPELKALGREIELLGRSAHLESKRWAPVIEASATYRRLAKFNDYDQYYLNFTPDSVAVGIHVALPLFTGGRFGHGRDEARARVALIEAERVVRESDLELAVRRAEAAVARAMAEKSLARRSQGLAGQETATFRLLAREGRVEADAVDEREIALADADEEAARAALSSLLERSRLLALRGELATAVLGAEPPCAVAP